MVDRSCDAALPPRSAKSAPSLDNFQHTAAVAQRRRWIVETAADVICCEGEKKNKNPSLHLMRDICLRGSLEDTEGRRVGGIDPLRSRERLSHLEMQILTFRMHLILLLFIIRNDCERLVDDLEYDYISYWHDIMYLPKVKGSLINRKS